MKMRQTTILLLAALLGAASIDAHAADLETSGELRVRSWYLDNYLANGKAIDFWDQRLRLTLNWPVAENVRLKARADILEGFWGDNGLTATPSVTEDPVTGGHVVTMKVTGTPAKRAIDFDWAFMQLVIPGTPLRLSLGRQDVSWGTGFWVQADNRDRFEVAAKLDPVIIVAAYDKFVEVFTDHGQREDQNGYAIGAVTDAVGFRFGLLAAYLKDGSRTRFPAGDISYLAGDVFAKGALGPAQLQAEFYYGSGTIDRGALGDLDVSGLGWYAGVFVPAGPAVTLGLEGAFARGNDPKTTGKNEGIFSADYQGPYWSVIFYNNLDYVGFAGDNQSSNPDLDFSVRNALTGKFSVRFAPTKKLGITGAGLYAAADQVEAGVDKALGWEFDLIAEYAVTEQVSFTAGVGYALLGDYWSTAPIAGGTGRTPDNPLGAVAAFTARF